MAVRRPWMDCMPQGAMDGGAASMDGRWLSFQSRLSFHRAAPSILSLLEKNGIPK
jgi:hypothetical protein